MIDSAQDVSPAATRSMFGALADGNRVEAVELRNQNGMCARFITLGACLQALHVPDTRGKIADVVLGYPAPQTFLDNPQYLGVTVGRHANRIAGARFSLDDVVYTLQANHGNHHLHGGDAGFDRQIWCIDSISSSPKPSVTMSYFSVEGEAGYPGNLCVKAIFTLGRNNQLRVRYEATTDKPTLVNLTNHSYFNLTGENSGVDILDHELQVHAAAYTPVDSELIPTGELRRVAGTTFDFRSSAALRERLIDPADTQLLLAQGLDHNFVIDGKAGQLRPAARLIDPVGGRVLWVATTAPGLQVYSGHGLDGLTPGKTGHAYSPRAGLCLEPQGFPDSPNQAGFPSARLNPGQRYVSETVYGFSTLDR